VKALRVELTDTLAYWTVVDDAWVPVPAADAYLRHLRLGADRAEGTTRVYAGDLALFMGWCAAGGRDLLAGARDLHLFVGMLKAARRDRQQTAGRGDPMRRSVARRRDAGSRPAAPTVERQR